MYFVCRLLLEKKKRTWGRREGRHGAGRAAVHRSGWQRCLEGDAHAPVGVRDVEDYSVAADFALFFFNDTATTEIYPLSLHDALPISSIAASCKGVAPLLALALTSAL